MQLSILETAILNLIGYDRYSSLSVDTNLEKIEDFSILHYCVWIARNEIKLNTIIPGLLKHATPITSSIVQARHTITDADFDIPVVVAFTDSNNATYYLKKSNVNSLLDDVADIVTTGDPQVYLFLDSTVAGLSYIEIYPVSSISGTIDIVYMPVLATLVAATDEDLIMKKYPETVIKIASAWAFQFIKKDSANYDKWLLLGRGDFKAITLREMNSDPKLDVRPDEFLMLKRQGRRTI